MSQTVSQSGFVNKWGVEYRISSEEFKKLKEEHKVVYDTYKKALAWWRWERKLEKNRVGSPPVCTKPSAIPILSQYDRAMFKEIYKRVLAAYRYMRAPITANVKEARYPSNYDKLVEMCRRPVK